MENAEQKKPGENLRNGEVGAFHLSHHVHLRELGRLQLFRNAKTTRTLMVIVN